MKLSSYQEFQTKIALSPGEERRIRETLTKKQSSFVKKSIIAFSMLMVFFLGLNLLVIFLPPTTAEGWIARGDAYYNEGNFQGAADAYSKAISYEQNSVEAWYDMGYALNALERYQEGLDAFNQALVLYPDSNITKTQNLLPGIWSGKGRSLHNLGRYQDALDAYNRALSINANMEYVWANKGNALGALERYPEALDAYNKALSIDPDLEYAWNGKGVVLENLGRYQEAVDAFNKALEIKPDYTLAQSNRQKILTKINTQNSADIKNNKLQQIQNLALQGEALADDDQYEKAIQYYDQGLALIGTDNDIEKVPLKKNLLSLKVYALNKLGRINEATETSKLITQG